jgi:tetratricopeptide (TPR) repeat protein
MRRWRLRKLGGLVVVLSAMPLGIAQQGGRGRGPSPGGGTPAQPSLPTTPAQPAPSSLPSDTAQQPRPLWISGTVVMSDGSEPPERVTIERLCSTNSIRPEGYTDKRGHFSFTLGQTLGILPDASTSVPVGAGVAGGPDLMDQGKDPARSTMQNAIPESVYWDCEIRARLPGYQSSSIALAGRRFLENPDVGTIVLSAFAKHDGLTVSATSGQAPKNARKAYEHGLESVQKNKPDQAEDDFRKAVQLYPRYAAAWFELGQVLERKEKYPDARAAYQQALAMDSNYVYPYQGLSRVAFHDQNWQELEKMSGQLLRLDPYEFPDAYYLNGVAELQLMNYDAAEQSARRAVETDTRNRNPKTHFLLGVILQQKKDMTGAADNFRAYLKASPNAENKAQIEKFLAEVDQAGAGGNAASRH